jgi:parvulin-like peptidyl-prolyl isomerase
MQMRTIYRIGKSLIPVSFIVLALWGCASVPEQDDVLAVVDGEPVTNADLEYSLEIAHRREDLSTARELDIYSYVDKLINDRLIVQEARRMGMDEYPQVQEKVRGYILRESVVRLYSEEVLEKVSVTEEDIIHYYKVNYERFTLDLIETETEEYAEEILTKLEMGAPFEEFSSNYPPSIQGKKGNDFVFSRESMTPSMQDALDGLNPGEFSSVTKVRDRYYILKLISREDAPLDKLGNIRVNIEAALRKQKVNERSDEYLSELRREAPLYIDQELLLSIEFDTDSVEREQWLKDDRTLVKVNDDVLSAGSFVTMLPSSDRATKEKILNRWLDFKIVDQEALRRNYGEKTDLKERAERYKNEQIKKTFTHNMIASEIRIAEREMAEYYVSHKEEFTRPVQYKIQQISLKSEDKAGEVMNSLNEGANFSWMAKEKSVDSLASRGGIAGWELKENMHDPVKDIIDNLKPGDISPILHIEDTYRIIRLMEKTEKAVESFDRVKQRVYQELYREKYRERYDDYVAKLRKEANIKINDEAVRSFEAVFSK